MSDLGESLEPWAMDQPSPETAVASDGLMPVLEERVSALVVRHREARQLVESLRSELAARDARITELTKQVGSDEQLRSELRERLGRVIDRVRQLEDAQSGNDGQ